MTKYYSEVIDLNGPLAPAIETLRWVKAQGIQAEAVVGGGFIRDSLLGRPVKDIDVFVRDIGAPGLRARRIMAEHGRCKLTQAQSEYIGHGRVSGVFHMEEGPAGLPTDLILSDGYWDGDGRGLITAFDFGICQVAVALCLQGPLLTYTDAFLKDRTNETITVYRDESDTRTPARLARLLQKYPGWRVIPYSDREPEPEAFTDLDLEAMVP